MKEWKINPLKEGTVIDHIEVGNTFQVLDILNIREYENTISIGINLESTKHGKKGLVKISERFLSKEEVDKIAIVAPKATLSIIKDFHVANKVKLNIPDVLNNIIKCGNTNCITNHEEVETRFFVLKKEPLKMRCHYCERMMGRGDFEIK